MIQRLKQFIEYKGFSIRKFEQYCGLNLSLIKSAERNNGSIGSDKLIKIIENFPDLDANWLLSGKGSMIRIDNLTHNETQPKQQKNTKNEENTNILLMEMMKQIRELTAENAVLKYKLENKGEKL